MKPFVPWIAAAVLFSAAAPALAVQGSWFTDPDPALAAAKKERKPVLAVAMDHA
jgi:hypothetical protein